MQVLHVYILTSCWFFFPSWETCNRTGLVRPGYQRRQYKCFQFFKLLDPQQRQYTHNLSSVFHMTLNTFLHTWQTEQNKLLARGPDSGSQTSSVILNNPSRLLWERRKGKPESIEIVSCLCNCLQLCLPKKKAPHFLSEEHYEEKEIYLVKKIFINLNC